MIQIIFIIYFVFIFKLYVIFMIHTYFDSLQPSAGNAMSVPCIGAVLTAVLLTCNLREQFGLHLTPSPSVGNLQNGEAESESDSGDSNGSTEPGGFSQEVRDKWPTISHAGSGVSPKDLEGLLRQPPGTVLSFSPA